MTVADFVRAYGLLASIFAYISLGILYNNLGNTYSDFKALQYYLKAKDNHEKSGKVTRHAAITFYHLADIYSSSNESTMDLELALEYAQRVLDFFKNEYADDLYMIGEAKYMLGKVYPLFVESKSNQVAYTLLSEAEEIFIQFLPSEDVTLIKVRNLKEIVRQKLDC